MSIDPLKQNIRACQICADRFAATHTAHAPRPIVWFRANPPILIAGQAPGMRVQVEGKPFWDRSGDRLRDWMGIGADDFYNRDNVSILPTAFCFPGYNAKGSDLPPPRICWNSWHRDVLGAIGQPQVTLIIGKYAIERHLNLKGSITEIVQNWRNFAPRTYLLPHPSWRNNAWIKRNPWFETDLIPDLRKTIAKTLKSENSGP